jgi:RNA polymerase sigma-70 factor (ECF subfamily)
MTLVYRYLRARARGHSEQDAEDRTQEFFLRVLVKGWLRSAEPQCGRFRDFLLTVLKCFAYDHTVRAQQQTQFERRFVSLHSLIQDSDRAYEPPAHETPEEAFHRQWKADVLAAVRRNLRACYEGLNTPEEQRRFEIFATYYFVDRAEDRPTQKALADQFGVSLDKVKDDLKEVRKRYNRFVRQELRDQAGSEEDVEDDVRDLLRTRCFPPVRAARRTHRPQPAPVVRGDGGTARMPGQSLQGQRSTTTHPPRRSTLALAKQVLVAAWSDE